MIETFNSELRDLIAEWRGRRCSWTEIIEALQSATEFAKTKRQQQ